MKRRWVKWGAVLLTVILCILASRRPKLPGVLGEIAAEVRVGMSRDEVASVIRRSYAARGENGPRLYTRGERLDGRAFGSYFDWQLTALPPSEEIAWGEFDVDNDDCRDLIITIRPNGVVTAVRLESSSIWEELRYSLAEGTGWSGWQNRARERHQDIVSLIRNVFDPY